MQGVLFSLWKSLLLTLYSHTPASRLVPSSLSQGVLPEGPMLQAQVGPAVCISSKFPVLLTLPV